MNIYLHIGLHKTATKYFQHHVFPFLDKEKFLYNPVRLNQYTCDYVKANTEHRHSIKLAIDSELKSLDEKFHGKTIVISREILSGNLFRAYEDWDERVSLLKEMFPTAKIIMGLRHQVKWLISCYRESVHEHHFQEIEQFFNYDRKNKVFKNNPNSKNTNGYANLYPFNLDYASMIRSLKRTYPEKEMLVYFYEDFCKDREKITSRILNFIGSSTVVTKPLLAIPNRGYSAFGIKLSITRRKMLSMIGLGNVIHRPIYFFGPDSIPAGSFEHSKLPAEPYWGKYFLRDNEEVRSANYPNLSLKEKLFRELTWRQIIKHRLDRIYYYDWSLIEEGMRADLDKRFQDINRGLAEHFPLDEIPKCYLGENS